MKPELDSLAKVMAWLTSPVPAVFQGQDLSGLAARIAAQDLTDCVFLGCAMTTELSEAAARYECFVIPKRTNLPFDPFTPGLYAPLELFDRLATGDTYQECIDRIIYESYVDPVTRLEKPADVDTHLLRRVHDWSIADALDELLDLETRKKTVAIMGGHDVPRDKPIFATVARLALSLAKEGYLVLTGGGPGLMEAGNLGAYCNGFADPEATLQTVLDLIISAPKYDHPEWLTKAYAAWTTIGDPDNPAKSKNVGIPTWFYGHEPPNIFSTHIAKYFENSVREEGLLAVALGGIIFAEGNGGTVQEIFQDANQNYYRTYAKVMSPMILFGVDYWAPPDMVRHNPVDKRKKLYPVLEKLAVEKGFSDYLLITDDTAAILKFIKHRPPV